ncbi:MAG: hypothetical protein V4719_28045 [Planctomycetota bacterium]
MQKSLDVKLAEIHADPNGSKAFIIADAKDADMAFGMGSAGVSPERHDGEVRFKTLAEYRQQIREIVEQGVVDIMLMSTHTSDLLTIQERIFDKSHITPAARANDTTDVHIARGSRTFQAPAMPFRSAALDHIQCGHLDCDVNERHLGANLGLYSVTFNNDPERDLEVLQQFKRFREEAERKKFRYFLEVFDPNIGNAVEPELLGGFINDQVARSLAGVAQAGRPAFLKIVYHGPKAMEELVRYDPHLVVGVLGGSAGTTLDAFQLIHQAQKYGARVALFGRKINQAENQLAFIEFLRLITDGVVSPEEAVRAYHAVLEKLGVRPHRSLEEDLTLKTGVMSYGGSGTTISAPPPQPKPAPVEATAPLAPSVEAPIAAPVVAAKEPVAPATAASSALAAPNFTKMTSAEKLAYHRERLKRMFGG